MTVLKGQVPKEREKSSKPQHTKTRAVLRLEEDKRLMGNFYCPDGSGLQSLTQTNPQHSWDFFFLNDDLLAKQRISQCTEHNKNNLQFSRQCWEGRTSSNPLPRRNKTKPEGKDCCNEAVPPQNRPAGGAAKPHCPAAASPHTPLPASSCQGTPAAVVYVRSLPNHNCCTPPRAGWGGQRDASRPQGPPSQALSPRLARGRGTSSVPCSLEQA